jgi:succinylglutamate desuccinylase
MDRVTRPLNRLEALPAGLSDITPDRIRTLFPAPTLIHLRGRMEPPVFLSCVLHGNETTGLRVLQRLQTWIESHGLPRSMLIFVGNVEAVEAGVRHLPHQPDFNRIWAGGPTPEHAMATQVLAEARAAQPFCAIDIHNNTGRNPLYACINSLEPAFTHLASLFSPTIVHFDNPPTVISMAMSKICPSVTIEAGRSDEPHGIEAALNLVLDSLHLHAFRTQGEDRPVTVFHTIGRVELAPEISFDFGPGPGRDIDVWFPENLERWNFSPQLPGHQWARLKNGNSLPLCVFDEARNDITDQFFIARNDCVELVRSITPSMLTRDKAVIRSDCLGYLMEAVSL